MFAACSSYCGILQRGSLHVFKAVIPITLHYASAHVEKTFGNISVKVEMLNDSSFASTEFPATVSAPTVYNSLPPTNQSKVSEFPFTALVVFGSVFVLTISLTKFSVLGTRHD